MERIHLNIVARKTCVLLLIIALIGSNIQIRTNAATGVIKGDANLDGIVDVKDLVEARKATISGENKNAADMDDNGVINEKDFHLIRLAVLDGKKEKANTYYVSNEGSDDNNGTSMDSPYLTIKKAIDKIEAESISGSSIKIIGEYILSAEEFETIHSKNVKIEGNDDNSIITIKENLFAKGDYTFKNITLNYPNGSCVVYANGNKVVFGTGIKTIGKGDGWWTFQNMISTGGVGTNTNSKPQEMVVNSGDYYRLYVGESRITTGQTKNVPGVEFVMNGGNIFQFILGGDGWDGTWGTNSFSGNVNLTFNDGTVGNSGITLSKYGVNNSYFQGGIDLNENAIQIIMNNGKNIPLDKGFTKENVNACNGKLYVLKCAEDLTCRLEMTENAGIYKVIGDAVAVATDGQNTYKSVGGLLEVPEGTYDVSWKGSSVRDVVFVSNEGSDEANGTKESPLKTINAAISTLNKVESEEKTIVLVGEVELPNSLTSHTDMITIRGNGEKNTQLVIKTGCEMNGPIKLETLAVNVTAYDKYFNSGGNKFVVGNNVTCSNWINMYVHLGTYTSNGSHEEAEINSGKFTNISIGSFYNEGYSYQTDGADLVLNGGTVQNINVYSDGWLESHKGVEFTDNVNITVNGGNFGKIVLTDAQRPTVYGKAVQILLNNGVSGGDVPSVDSINASGGYWIMRSNSDGALETTDTAGEYKVKNGKTAVATSVNGNDVYISENGILTVPKEGEYNVEYSDVLYYTNSGEEIIFYEDCNVELSGMKHTEKEGKLFIGWTDADGNKVQTKAFKKGTVLKAKYIEFDTEKGFVLDNITLKKTKTDENQTIAYTTKIDSTMLSNLQNSVTINEMGSLNIKSEYLGIANLELGLKYKFDGKEYTADSVIFSKADSTANGYDNYISEIENIEGRNFKDQFTVKAYIKYTDMNGYDKILYTKYANGSVYSLAKRMLALSDITEEDKQYYTEIKEYAEKALKEAYLSQKKKKVNIEGDINPYDAFYKFENGLSVREVSIDTGSEDDNAVEIVQGTDFHYNYCNEQDLEEKNPSTMSTYYNRGLNPNGSSVRVTSKCMEYASFFDQTVVTGDVIDYLSHGALELMQKYIWDPYPDTLVTLGNHDPVRVMGLPTDVPDPTSVASRFEILQKYWKHDLYYESRLVKDKVLVVQMDDGQNKFWDVQVDKLKADIEKARNNNYTILIFIHEPISTGNPNDTNVPYLYTGDSGSATPADFYKKDVVSPDNGGATKSVYDLIINNGDVIRGVFTGHLHNDHYTEIEAKTASGEKVIIPQYTLCGSFYGQGHVMKITVK